MALAACGSDPFCGDGKTSFELGEQCDDGNNIETDDCLNNCMVRPVPQLTIKWEFNQDLDIGFQGDSCFDVGADKVTVRLVGPGVDATDVIDCSMRQVRHRDIVPGMYTASLTVADVDEVALLNAVHTADLVFSGGTDEEAIVVIPPERWATAYLGTFFFRLDWGELENSCEAATPPVVDNSLLLSVGGVPYPGMTDAGHLVDGSVFSPCRPLSESSAQAVLSVPFGSAQFTVAGRDNLGALTHEQTFETFVGAGINNPELRFHVPMLPMPDAGVDAGVDAML